MKGESFLRTPAKKQEYEKLLFINFVYCKLTIGSLQ